MKNFAMQVNPATGREVFYVYKEWDRTGLIA
jgi:hypothetical protein